MYDTETVDAPYDFLAHEADAAATTQRYQEALDLLYAVGCQYSINNDHMRQLCNHMGVCWFDLQRHNSTNSINTTKANICQSPACSLVNLVPAKQPVYAI